MADKNRRGRIDRSLVPEVIAGSGSMAECDKRAVVGHVGAVAGMLAILASEVWHNGLPEGSQPAIIFSGAAVAAGGLWQAARASRLRKCHEREPDLLQKMVANLPPRAGDPKEADRRLYEVFASLDRKQLAYQMAVKTGDPSAVPLTADEAARHAALVRLTGYYNGAGLVNGAAAQVLHWVGCALPPEMTTSGRHESRRESRSEAGSMHQTTLDILDQYVPLDKMTWREYVASPEFAAVCGSAQQIDQGLRLQAKPLSRRSADCFSPFSQYRPPREDN